MELKELAIHGHSIAFRTAGSGPVLLLIHGMAGSGETWRLVISQLAEHFTVVAPDLLGHGASAKPRAEYSLGAHANVLRDLLAMLGHGRATIVGHSYGGGVAMQLAYQFPERCERIALVGSGGLGQEVNPLLRTLALPGAEQLFPLACFPKLRDAGQRVAEWLGSHGLRVSATAEEIWRSYASLAEHDSRQAFFRTLHAVIDHRGQSVSAADRLYLTAMVPTLIVWGERDAVIPVEHAHAAHRAIAASRLELFEGAGHYPHCEAPERFVQTLAEFVCATEPARLSEPQWLNLLRRPDTAADDGAASEAIP